jgi:hypothetical protein
MTFNPRIWYPIAVLGAVLNVVRVAFAARPGEPSRRLLLGFAPARAIWMTDLSGKGAIFPI